MIGKQLHLSKRETLRQEVIPVKNDEGSIYRKKPAQGTGLWTSSWREETRDSDWIEWCRSEEFGDIDAQSWFLLTLAKDTRLCVISSYYELTVTLKRFPLRHPRYTSQLEMAAVSAGLSADHFTGIDFERLAQEYDGLHLTEEAAGALHLSYPLDMNTWDCESTLWFRWVFTNVERIEVQKPVVVGD